MFDKLTHKITAAIKSFQGNAVITEVNVSQAVKEIRKALLDADVHYQIAKDLTNTIKEKAIGQQVLKSVSPGSMITKIMQDEFTALMGKNARPLSLKNKPAVLMVIGLQGSGKTTFVAKLANLLKQKEKRNPIIIAADIHRPAAVNQLEALGQKIDVPVFTAPNQSAEQVVEQGLVYAKANLFDTIIIDTAGRQVVDDVLMQEAEQIKKISKPEEVLFVLDAMIGQEAVNTAKTFHDRLQFSGIVMTKLDGDARGGAALSTTYITGVPIKYVSDGEKPEDISVFYPDRMAQRILGMGDVVSLVEKAQAQFDQKEAEKLEKKIRKAQFDFNDFKEQLQKIKNMGNLKDLMGMIPGMGQKIKDVHIDERKFVYIEAIINSMTPHERQHPECLKESRKLRIAKGSGRSVSEVNALIKQFEQMQKMMKGMANGRMPFGF